MEQIKGRGPMRQDHLYCYSTVLGEKKDVPVAPQQKAVFVHHAQYKVQ
jgi:hypothetical protein